MCKERTRNIEIVAAQGFRMRGSRLSPPAKKKDMTNRSCLSFWALPSGGGFTRKRKIAEYLSPCGKIGVKRQGAERS